MTQVVYSPIEGSVLRELPLTTAAEVEVGISAARAAQVEWARRHPSERGRLIASVAGIIESRVEEIAELESRNTGKLLSDTRREVLRAAGSFRYYGGWADKVVGEMIPMDGDHLIYTSPEPYGVAAGIIPWNVPFFFAAKKIAPALAFGNACVLKPAEDTPLTALLLKDMLRSAGIPEDLVQVFIGGREVGEAVVASPNVDLIVFTGSDATGRAIARSAAERLVPVAMELGGKSPQVVFQDADLEKAADAITLGVFASCGQMCIAGSRLVVHRSVHRALVDLLAERVRGLTVGDPFESGTDVGPQITSLQRDKTLAFIEETSKVGKVVAQASMPGNPALSGGFYVPPTIFDDLPPDARVLRDEVFGPVLAVTTFDDDEEAVELANRTDFGLAAGIWTSDIGRAHRMAAAVRAGTVWINTYRVLSELVPFGGIGLSGYGRENGTEAARLYTRPKSVWTSLAPGAPAGFTMGQ
ncbi:aldehyde dehydrogenase family protein [Leifsonia bigeumensis]|uniref:Aldehyde dehydrogenase family protein n=1 Tax=Leifsonella bigeumensis TaxID=433643 RepID=A0ABP7FIZ4_9MICO